MTKIMLVEDDNNLREIYQARLNSEGYETVTASDGEEALSIVGKEKPDLIILDVMMPKISGFDTLDLLKNSPVTKDIKVIMMTALSQAEDRARAQKLGAQNYLVKSQVTLEDIVKAIKDALDGTSVYPNSDAPATATDSSTPTPSVFNTSTSVDAPTTSPVAAPAPPSDSMPMASTDTPTTDAPAPAGVSIEHVDEPAADPMSPASDPMPMDSPAVPTNDQTSPMPEITLPDAPSTDAPAPPSDPMPMASTDTPTTDEPATAGVSIEHVDEPATATSMDTTTPPVESPETPAVPTDSNPAS